jgi:hypothetical protein
MTYQEIFDEVKLLSKRFDIDDKIAIAIRMATLRLHRTDFYYRDLIEAQVYWTAADTIVDLNVVTWLYNYRSVQYVRYWDPDTLLLGKMLDPIDPRDVLDEYNYERLDRWYNAGDVLKMRFSVPTRGAQIGYFSSPIVHPTTQYNSWIAVDMPDIIIQSALAYLFNMTGKQEEARAINIMVGLEAPPSGRAQQGPTMLEQLKQFALEGQAR